MNITVLLLAFGKPDETRTVENVPQIDNQIEQLEEIFRLGQNDFQPQPHPSVSVGDVISLPDGTLHLVAQLGFRQISQSELEQYKQLDQVSRIFSDWIK